MAFPSKMHKGDPEIPAMGMPQPWSVLLRRPTSTSRNAVSELLATRDEAHRTSILEQLAHQDLTFVAEFLNSCQALTFYFVGWDHSNYTVVMRCGPSRADVEPMLNWRGKPRRRRRGVSEEVCEQVYEAVEIVFDELDLREKVSYVLMSWLDDERMPEIRTSLDHTHADAWESIRLTLPVEFAESLPKAPPPSALELLESSIEPASPSVLEPDPTSCPVAWHVFQRHNFSRLPTWRWERAWAIVRHGRYVSRRRDDEQTGQAVRFLRELIKTPQDGELIEAKFPDLLAAHTVRTGPNDRRIELEARILAKQSSREISDRLSVSPAAVDWYASTFFDVRGRLDSKVYIQKRVIGTDWAFGPLHLAIEGLIKTVAYRGGPVALDTVLPYLRDDARELDRLTGGDEVQDTFAERLDLLLRAAALPLDRTTRKQLARRYPDLIANLPRLVQFRPVVGSYAQIVAPFAGELAVTTAAAEESVEVSQRAA